MSNWRPKTGDIPDSPGVYLFRDPKSSVIYVGKAKSLKHRIPNYFGFGLHPRTESMVECATSVEWIITANEVEALQLEVTLIKEHRPRFNVRYRDDKSYPYLALTVSEEFPRAIVVRGKKKKGDRYFGPFAHAYAIRETLDLLLRVFPIRSCSQGVFDRAKRSKRPCLLFDIGRCSGPCVGEVTPEFHRELVEGFIGFMDGDREAIVSELEKQMLEASQSLEFEQAARLRDRLQAVRKVIERQEMVTERRVDLDAVAFMGDDLEASFQIFIVRGGRVVGRKGFIVDRVEDMSDQELMESFLENHYLDEEVPKEVLVEVMPASSEVLEEWLSIRRGSKVTLRIPERGSRRRLLQTVHDNANQAFGQSRLKRATDFASRSKALNELQARLGLPEAPLRIECFDISNLGPSEVVASMVVFEDALPKKSDYRKFKIQTVEGQDDVGSMGEVIHRRFSRYLEDSQRPVDKDTKFAYQPGLVVVDGGKGQLNRAVEVMSELGIVGIPIVGLAKRFEEVYLPERPEPIVIPRGSEALYLLQRIRDEAHRFAVQFQRQRRAVKMTRSIFDELPNVGDVRKKALRKYFGSAVKLREAELEELVKVPGIGPETAKNIYEYLRNVP